MSKKVLRMELAEKNDFAGNGYIVNGTIVPEYTLKGCAIFLYETEEERQALIELAEKLGTFIIQEGDFVYVFEMQEKAKMNMEKMKEFLEKFRNDALEIKKECNTAQKNELSKDKENLINSLMDKFEENKNN